MSVAGHKGLQVHYIKHWWQSAMDKWLKRQAITNNTYAREHYAFLPAALEIQQTPANDTAQRIGQLVILLLLTAIIWSITGKVDVVAIAEGKIIPGSRVKIIQPLDKGIIQAIFIHEGEMVKQGQKLVELDTTVTVADQVRLQKSYTVARMEALRMEKFIALVSGESKNIGLNIPATIDAGDDEIIRQQQLLQQQWQQYQSRLGALQGNLQARQAELETLQANIAKLQQTLPIVEQRADNYKKLSVTNMVAKDDYLKIEQERIEQRQNLASMHAQSRQINASIVEAGNNLEATRAEAKAVAWQQLVENQEKVNNLHEQLAKAVDVNAHQILYAPVDGVVQELKINTIGGVVTEAQALMTIVPSDENLEVLAYIDNKDIGYIHAGMPAEIKVETFPFTQYGVINATVKTVTDDAIANQDKGLFFSMLLVMGKNTMSVHGKPVRLRPGMKVSAEVKTGTRRIIEYLLTPVTKGFQESIRER